MKPVYLRGIGLWSQGFADPESWCRGEMDPELVKAVPNMLEGPLRRRASSLTRISVEAFDQATRAAGMDPVAIPTIWATAHGEHGTAIKLLKMMLRGDGKVSPTHFHNSVHNTPSAYASIAGGNANASTTLTGGPELVASAILEALCHLESGAQEIAVILADEPLHEPFERTDMQAALALAFCFSREPEGASLRLSNLRRDNIARLKPHERVGGLHVSAGLSLLEHAVAGKTATVSLENEDPKRPVSKLDCEPWCIDLETIAPE